MNNVTIEWVVLPRNIAVVASEIGQFWLVALNDHGEIHPFARPMTGPGSRGSTAALLDGAIACGFGGEQEQPKECTVSLSRYVFDLVGSYHNARRTPGHFRQAAARFAELRRPDIGAYLERHAREETGHDRLVLKDLRALGLPAERIVANLIPKGVAPLCALFDRLSAADYPVGVIGYSYCFESSAAVIGESEVAAFQALWPAGIDASRFLRTHSGLGSEVSHVEDMIGFVASLPAFDRTEIVKAAYETAATTAVGLRRQGLMSDAEVLAKIRAAAGEEIDFRG
jgi:hypothetical protein